MYSRRGAPAGDKSRNMAWTVVQPERLQRRVRKANERIIPRNGNTRLLARCMPNSSLHVYPILHHIPTRSIKLRWRLNDDLPWLSATLGNDMGSKASAGGSTKLPPRLNWDRLTASGLSQDVLGQEQQPGELVRDKLISTNGRLDHILLFTSSQPKLLEANLYWDKLAAEILGRDKFGSQAERLILHRRNEATPRSSTLIVLALPGEMVPSGWLVLASWNRDEGVSGVKLVQGLIDVDTPYLKYRTSPTHV